MLGGAVIPAPEGADVTTPEGLKAAMPLLQPRHFIFPFLAHAAGTFTGALLAALIAASRKMMFAWVIGICFFAGGLASVCMLPSPVWYTVVDLVGAYFPMAWLAGRIALKNK